MWCLVGPVIVKCRTKQRNKQTKKAKSEKFYLAATDVASDGNEIDDFTVSYISTE